MIKSYFTFLIVVLFSAVLLYGQTHQLKIHSKQILENENYMPAKYDRSLVAPTSARGDAESIGLTTNYDYFSNSVVRDQVVYYDGVQQFANMIRPFPGWPDPTVRHVTYTYWDGSAYQHISVFQAQSGWPQIDVALTGSVPGTVGIVGHQPCQLALYDGAGGFILSPFDDYTDPSLQFLGDKIFLATSGNRLNFQFYETDDFGVTFTNWDSMSAYSPTPIYWTANGGVEVDMFKSPDEQTIVYAGTNAGDGHVYDGVPEDHADNVWQIYSTDAGATWTAESFGYDGEFDVVDGYHTANFAPLFENFGQIDGAVGNDGVMHYVANGYGLVFNATHDTAIANSFPLLYWNSSTRRWKSISSEAIDTIQAIGDLYPTNCIGQSYPGIAVSDDGQYVFATWTGPEMTDGEIDTAGGEGVFWRDLYYNWSSDGGTTWEGPQLLQDGKFVSETYAHPAQRLQDNGDGTYTAHIVYLEDLTATVSLFAGTASDDPIMYQTMIIGTASGINENSNTVNSFNLEQNYPNPFNPTTRIKYSVAQRSNVSLKVYDMLGSEVATLVNTTKDAGNYEVNFNASNLASGLYVYKIQAGNFTQSKKMMLLK